MNSNEKELFWGRYPATVEDNQDPEKAYRLRVRCPALADKPLDWALPCGVPMGIGYGVFVLPQKGDAVWVSFQYGDLSKPIWEYGAIQKGSRPEEATGSTILITTKARTQIILRADGKVEIKNEQESLGKVLDDLMLALKSATTLDNAGHTGTFTPDVIAKIEAISLRFKTLIA